MESPRKTNRGRGRGVLALTSYEPCPRPSVATIGMWHKPSKIIGKRADIHTLRSTEVVKHIDAVVPSFTHHRVSCDNDKKTESDMVQVNNDTHKLNQNGHHPAGSSPEGFTLMAKYNYKANAHKTGGFDEITIRQGEKLKLLQKGHKESQNPLWWEVQNVKGEQGFVPASYCLPLEETPSTLPWLENKRLLEEKQRKIKEEEISSKSISGFGEPAMKPQVKAYRSAYSNPTVKNSAEASFFCEICDKALNGPQPYKAHMSSKAHREEVDYQREKASTNK